jgi:hypothetical protein
MTRAVADQMVRSFSYASAIAFVRQLSRQGFVRPYIPAPRTLRAAEIRRLPSDCDIGYHAARLGLRPADLRRRLRRRRRMPT